jgi:hypothetical protein
MAEEIVTSVAEQNQELSMDCMECGANLDPVWKWCQTSEALEQPIKRWSTSSEVLVGADCSGGAISRKSLIDGILFVAHQLLMRHRNFFCGASDSVRHKNMAHLNLMRHRKSVGPTSCQPQ